MLAGRIAVTIDEAGGDAVRRLTPVLQVMAGEDVCGANARARGVEQKLQQDAAMNRELRPFVAGLEAARLRPDLLAVLGVVGVLFGAHVCLFEPVEETELDQLAVCMRQDVDADADRLQFRNALEDPHLDADLVQAECDGQPGNAAAGHEHGHEVSPLLRNTKRGSVSAPLVPQYSPAARGLASAEAWVRNDAGSVRKDQR